MAEIKIGILGGMSGKIGSVVGAIWRGKNIHLDGADLTSFYSADASGANPCL